MYAMLQLLYTPGESVLNLYWAILFTIWHQFMSLTSMTTKVNLLHKQNPLVYQGLFDIKMSELKH